MAESISKNAHPTWFSHLCKTISKHSASYLFILPALLVYLIFFLLPFINTIYYSLTDWNGIDAVKKFIGIGNYIKLAQDPLMWLSLQHNLIWVVIGTISPVAIGLLLAVLIWNGKTRGRIVFRTAYFMPVVLSPVVIGIIWGWIYNPIFGIVNQVLTDIGLGSWTRGWLGDPTWALYAVLATAIWSYFGFCLVILLAGLQNVDMDLFDAAKIDGANSWQQLINVIIPQLGSVLTMVVVYTLIGGFNVFDIVYVMTGGGPANFTEVIATYTYKKSFVENSVGYGAALSMVMTIISLAASFIFLKFRERGEA